MATRRFRDYSGVSIRLTDERLWHIDEFHPEVDQAEKRIQETLASPELVVQSAGDPLAQLYYRYYFATRVGDKYLCVVTVIAEDPFVLTAYFTEKPKNGEPVWRKE